MPIGNDSRVPSSGLLGWMVRISHGALDLQQAAVVATLCGIGMIAASGYIWYEMLTQPATPPAQMRPKLPPRPATGEMNPQGGYYYP